MIKKHKIKLDEDDLSEDSLYWTESFMGLVCEEYSSKTVI